MSCNAGFNFETYVPVLGSQRERASSFFNAGTINCGTLDTSNYLAILSEHNVGGTNWIVTGNPGTKTLINATNVVNPGKIHMGYESLLQIQGENLDLSRGSFLMDVAGTSVFSSVNLNPFFYGAIFDGNWNIGDPVTQGIHASNWTYYPQGINPSYWFGSSPPQTPIYYVKDRDGNIDEEQMTLTNAISYVFDSGVFNSNRTVRVAFVSNTNLNLGANVYFPTSGTFNWEMYGDIVVEWNNKLQAGANNLYVCDPFGVYTNFYLVLNGFAGVRPTYIPWNFWMDIFQSQPLALGTPESPASVAGVFDPYNTTNEFAAYRALLQPSSVILGDVFGQDVTNVPGRIEISADKRLDLSRAQIASLNYVKVEATNHFVCGAGATISTPFADLNLRSTNGTLAISNMMQPVLMRPGGYIDLWSTRWTNVIVGVTNQYHVLFVDTHVTGESLPLIRNLTLHSVGGDDNIFISDSLNVSNSMLLDAVALTITTNEAGSLTPAGSLNLSSSMLLWPSATPRLQYLTNYGGIHTMNAAFFGGSRTSPYYSSNYNEPYQAFVNGGTVSDYGSLIWARYFQNSGIFQSGSGSISLLQNERAILTNGQFLASLGNISINSDALLVSNHLLQAAGTITLTVTNVLSDGIANLATLDPTNLLTGTVSNGNAWTCAGLSLPICPAIGGDLLGTTITNYAASNQVRNIVWAGKDLRITNAGYLNNAAIGHLVLHGQDANSQFVFSGPDSSTNYALYVDHLELRGATATTTDQAGNYTNVVVAPNMKVYFAQATANGIIIADRIAYYGLNGGRLIWVSNYNYGYFSSTNIAYPDGTTNRVNTALAQSTYYNSNPNFPGPNSTHPNDPIEPIIPWTPTNNNVPLFPDLAWFTVNPIQININAGQSCSQSIKRLAIDPPYDSQLVFAKLSGPSWLQVSANGDLAGTPGVTDGGSNTFRLSVTTAGGISSTGAVSIYVNRAPFFISTPFDMTPAVVGQSYSALMTGMATDPDSQDLGSLTFAKISGPDWLTVASSGSLLGTPAATNLGINSFVVSVSDSSGLSNTGTMTITVITNALLKLNFPTASGGSGVTAAGAYSGLFFDPNGIAPDSAGYFTATVNARSNFTAKIFLGGRTCSLSGRFDPATGLFPEKSVRIGSSGFLTVRLQLVVANDQIRGTITTTGSWKAQVVADRLTYKTRGNAASAANYTMFIPPDTNGPDGYGFGTVKLSTAGKVQWAGTLADGSKVTQSSALSRDHYWPLFGSLYSGKGLVIGWVQLTTNNVSGVEIWLRPSTAATKSFSDAFTNAAEVFGADYQFRSHTKVLDLTMGEATLSGGILGGNSFQSAFTLDSSNRAKSQTNKLTLSIKTSTGLFSGAVVTPQAGKISFQGALFPDATNGFGFFLNSKHSGAVQIAPAQ
jgi:hypothetical protein